MSQTVYVRYQYVTRHEQMSGFGLSDTIVFNGFDTGLLRYYEVGGNSFPGDRDYIELGVAEMTFTPQNTQLLGSIQTETSTHTYPIWITRSVPDDFVIPSPPPTPQPELRVSLSSVSPATVSNTGQFTVHVDYSNSGDLNAGAFQLAIYFSRDAVADSSDLKWLWGDEPPLTARTSTGFSMTIPLDPDWFVAGQYYVYARIDSDGRIAERNENNNVSNLLPLTITSSNRAPILTNDTITITGSGPASKNILANGDRDPDGDTITLTAIKTAPTKGTAAFSANGTVTYTPSSNVSPADVGSDGLIHDSFVVKASDGHGGTATETVNVTFQHTGDWFVDLGTLGPFASPAPVNTPTNRPNQPHVPNQPAIALPTLFGNLQFNQTVTYEFDALPFSTLYWDYHANRAVTGAPATSTPSLQADIGNIEPDLNNQKMNSMSEGFGTNPRWYEDPLMPGTYQIVLTNIDYYDGSNPQPTPTAIGYRIHRVLAPDHAGNTPYWARNLGTVGNNTTTSYSEFASRGDGIDYYQFTITQPSAVALALVTQTPLAPLTLYAVDPPGTNDPGLGVPLGFTHYARGGRYDVQTTGNLTLPAGTYYFYVEHPTGLDFNAEYGDGLQGAEERRDRYNVFVTAWTDRAANTAATATNLGAINNTTVTFSDSINIADSNDWFRFTVSQASSLAIQLQNANPSFQLGLEFARFNPIDLSVLPGTNSYFAFATPDASGNANLLAPQVQLDPGVTYWVRVYARETFATMPGLSYDAPFIYPDLGGSNYTLNITTAAIAPGSLSTITGNAGPNVLIGNAGASTITGRGGGDTVHAGGGDDRVVGGPGNNTYNGGTGLNTLDYSGAPAGVQVDLLAGKAANGYGGTDKISEFAVVYGSSYADTLKGDNAANQLFGGPAKDTIEGLGGADHLDGGLGTNTLSYASDTVGVIVNLLSNTASGLGSHAHGDTILNFRHVIGGSGGDTITGDGLANTLAGKGGNDRLVGDGGNDTLNGGDGNDTVLGGPGDDLLNAGSGANGGTSDTVSYADISANVAVSLALTEAQDTGGAGRDTLTGFENLTGGGGHDTLTGDSKPNAIDGGPGNDVLKGGVGADVLTGGPGNDVFRFNNALQGGDTIVDYVPGVDHIGIGRAGFGIPASVSLTGAGANNFGAEYFVLDGAANRPHGQFLFSSASDQLRWDPDGTGGAPAALIATFSNGATLGAADFLLL